MAKVGVAHFTKFLLSERGSYSLRKRLTIGAVGTFGLKIASTGFAFLVGLMLARLLGTAGFGAYSYALNWIALLTVPAVMGLDRILARNMVVYQKQADWGLMRGLLQWVNKVGLLTSCGIALAAAGIAKILAGRVDSQILPTLWIALLTLPLITVTILRKGALQGLHCVVIGQVPEMLIQPPLFIALVGAFYFLLGHHLTSSTAMMMNVLSAAITCLLGTALLYKAIPQETKKAQPVYRQQEWLKSAFPLLFVNGMYVLNDRIGISILGAVKGAEAVGVYAVANRLAELIPFVLVAVNTALSPVIASLYAEKNMKKLQQIVTKSSRIVFSIALPTTIGLALSGYWLLSLFGPDFTQGKTALIILSMGQLVSAASGSVGWLLVMTGHERDVALGVGFSAALNTILNIALVPKYGFEGTAIAVSISAIVWNLWLVGRVHQRLRIHSTALGVVNFPR